MERYEDVTTNSITLHVNLNNSKIAEDIARWQSDCWWDSGFIPQSIIIIIINNNDNSNNNKSLLMKIHLDFTAC